MRVFELSKAFGVNSKGLVTLCKDLGEPVKSHMSQISEELWYKLQDRMKIPEDKRLPYQKKTPKKKAASKKSTVTSKTRKTAKDDKVDESKKIMPAKESSSAGSDGVKAGKKKTSSKTTKKKTSVSKKETPSSKKEKEERLREDKLLVKNLDLGLLKKNTNYLPPKPPVVEEVAPVNNVEELRQRVRDSQDSRGDQLLTGGLIRNTPKMNQVSKRQAFQNRVASRRGRRRKVAGEKVNVEHLKVQLPITVRQLSGQLHLKVNDIINRVRHHDGTVLEMNAELSEDVLITIGLLFNVDMDIVGIEDHHQQILKADEMDVNESEELFTEARPPVVAILGHVDHGKTSLLDYIRKSRVASREAGGITQHIGAYQITHKGHPITFIDTPGHQVFTEMRARGARSTDIVILLVAADDGVMPQTVESIQHAQAAEVPILVVVNKMDTPGADLDKVKQQLTQYELVAEDWGGQTIVCPVSAVTGEGIDHLLEMIVLQAEVMELKANPALKAARGVVLESSLSKQKGVVCTLLVQNGTLRKGDIIVCGETQGKIRALTDENNQQLDKALPSRPVQVIGLMEPPEVASRFMVVDDMAQAREIAEQRKESLRRKESHVQEEPEDFDLDNVFDAFEDEGKESVFLILKADVRGSLEALTTAVEAMSTVKVPVKIIGKSVGGVSESDVILAKASDAMILGFNVVADAKARKASKSNKIDIKLYRVIYELLDDLKAVMEGRVASERREDEIGQAEVREVFTSSKFGMICGCMVTDGVVRRGSHVRVSRNGIVIHHGTVESLRRFKEDAKEVREGFECGIRVKDYNDIKPGDSIHFFEVVEVAGVLE
jgi:translation initiation factor IF-2